MISRLYNQVCFVMFQGYLHVPLSLLSSICAYASGDATSSYSWKFLFVWQLLLHNMHGIICIWKFYTNDIGFQIGKQGSIVFWVPDHNWINTRSSRLLLLAGPKGVKEKLLTLVEAQNQRQTRLDYKFTHGCMRWRGIKIVIETTIWALIIQARTKA